MLEVSVAKATAACCFCMAVVCCDYSCISNSPTCRTHVGRTGMLSCFFAASSVVFNAGRIWGGWGETRQVVVYPEDRKVGEDPSSFLGC